jgi:hypothetical protein
MQIWTVLCYFDQADISNILRLATETECEQIMTFLSYSGYTNIADIISTT